jgi:hypothetical protein
MTAELLLAIAMLCNHQWACQKRIIQCTKNKTEFTGEFRVPERVAECVTEQQYP